MTYIVLMGTLNPTHSLTHSLAVAREKDITAFLRYQSRHSSM